LAVKRIGLILLGRIFSWFNGFGWFTGSSGFNEFSRSTGSSGFSRSSGFHGRFGGLNGRFSGFNNRFSGFNDGLGWLGSPICAVNTTLSGYTGRICVLTYKFTNRTTGRFNNRLTYRFTSRFVNRLRNKVTKRSGFKRVVARFLVLCGSIGGKGLCLVNHAGI
jgi:hypothetical protein